MTAFARSTKALADGGGAPNPAPDFLGVREIAVFRALMLGDMLCAVPALRAIRRAFPQARLTLIALPWARELASRLAMIDAFVDFPGHPALPEREPELAAWPGFCRRLRERRFDLLIQLHGSGRIVNPLLRQWGARTMAGFYDEAAAAQGFARRPENRWFVQWPREGHEIVRLLQLTRQLGIDDDGTALEYPVTDSDRDEMARAWPGFGDQRRPYVCLHVGAQLPSRRWLPLRFAAVADRLADRGFTVVLTGSDGESQLVASVARTMHSPVVNLAGRTSLWTLGALVERAALVVANDTGISHIAAALGAPSVIVSCGADTGRWAPLDSVRHRVLAQPTACRPCAWPVCPFGHECATGVGADDVWQVVEAALEQVRPGRGATVDAPTTSEVTQ